VSANAITNADQGILLTWWTPDEVPHMAITTGTTVSMVNVQLPGAPQVAPVLQAQDGSFLGVYSDEDDDTPYMVAFDASGNVRWTVPNDQPQIATADGGVIGQSGITYDSNGNATGTMSVPILSLTGTAYEPGQASQVWTTPIFVATGYWSFGQLAGQAAGPASNGTATELPEYTLNGPTMVKTIYNQANPNVWDCLHDKVGPFGVYGYQECASYRVFDKGNPPQQIVRKGLAFDEKMILISNSANLTNAIGTQGNGATIEGGLLVDNLSLVQTNQPLPAGTYLLKEQIITLHSTGIVVRVNCLDYEATDVTVTEITGQYNPAVNPNTQCKRIGAN
jgi:hypothetical protein